MSKIIKKLRGKRVPTSSSAGNNNNDHDKDIVNTKIQYHGPYRDSSGEQFFLPREWKRTTTIIGGGGGSKGRRKKSSNDHHRGAWKESLVNYNFNKEMNGIKNLNWLRRTNELMDKAACMMTAGELDSGEDESDDVVGEEDEPRRKGRRLVGGGSSNNNKRSGEECMDECKLRRALPDMANTLNNWTLHGQNLGSMLANYHMQSRRMKKRQRNELGISLIRLRMYWI